MKKIIKVSLSSTYWHNSEESYSIDLWRNAKQQQINLIDIASQKVINADVLKELMLKNKSFSFLVIKNNINALVTLSNQEDHNFSLEPKEPYAMKDGFGSLQENIDMAKYIELTLELCENFAIYRIWSEDQENI